MPILYTESYVFFLLGYWTFFYWFLVCYSEQLWKIHQTVSRGNGPLNKKPEIGSVHTVMGYTTIKNVIIIKHVIVCLIMWSLELWIPHFRTDYAWVNSSRAHAPPPPRLTPRHKHFLGGWQIPRGGTLKLPNAPQWGCRKRANAPSPGLYFPNQHCSSFHSLHNSATFSI